MYLRQGSADEYGPNGECLIERFIADSDPYRASSASRYCRPFHYKFGRDIAKEDLAVLSTIEDPCRQYMTEIGLPEPVMNIQRLMDGRDRGHDTLVVQVYNGQAMDPEWRAAAAFIQAAIREQVVEQGFDPSFYLAVELRRSDLMVQNISSPIRSHLHPGIHEFLDAHCEEIEAIVESHVPENSTSIISYMARGPPWDGADKAVWEFKQKPSVCVTTKKESSVGGCEEDYRGGN